MFERHEGATNCHCVKKNHLELAPAGIFLQLHRKVHSPRVTKDCLNYLTTLHP